MTVGADSLRNTGAEPEFAERIPNGG